MSKSGDAGADSSNRKYKSLAGSRVFIITGIHKHEFVKLTSLKNKQIGNKIRSQNNSAHSNLYMRIFSYKEK